MSALMVALVRNAENRVNCETRRSNGDTQNRGAAVNIRTPGGADLTPSKASLLSFLLLVLRERILRDLRLSPKVGTHGKSKGSDR